MSLASRKLIQAAGAGDTGDDDFANVVLLLDGDGTSGDDNNTFTDSSTNGYTITENGDVVQGSFSPYGDNWSVFFDGSNDAIQYSGNTSEFAFGTGDFTIEAWVNFSSISSSRYILSTYDGNQGGFSFSYDGNNSELRFRNGDAGVTGETFNPETGVWYHVAVSRDNSTLRFFVDGTQLGSDTTNYTQNIQNVNTYGLQVGRYKLDAQPIEGSYFHGFISNARIIKGSALYTSGFTPSTSPLTAVTGTEFLGCQSNRFVDNSGNSFTQALNSTPKVTPFSPFKDDDARDITTDGGSGHFDGASATHIYAGTSSSMIPSTGDFTIEGWFYFDGINTTSVNRSGFFIKDSGFSGTNRTIQIHFENNGSVYNNFNAAMFNGSSADYAQFAYTFNQHEWYHVALTRTGADYELFINGVSQGTETIIYSTINSTTEENWVGSWDSGKGSTHPGYIGDFRIVHSRVYTSNFTPPTSPLTAIANTELLLNFQDAGIYDRSGINNLDTVGNAQIDTAVKKYGTGSMEFDGTGDYLTTNSLTELSFGTGDFTIEGWFYVQSGDEFPYILDFRSAASQAVPVLYFYNYGNGSIAWAVNGSDRILGTSAGNDVWQHIAVCRSGTSTKMFVNGTQSGSTYTDSTNYAAYSGNIARRYTDNRYFKGYMDDFRITKGVARYTANFTPPTAALPKF